MAERLRSMRSWLGLKSMVRRSAAEPVLGTPLGAPAAALKLDNRPLGRPRGLGRGAGRLPSTGSVFIESGIVPAARDPTEGQLVSVSRRKSWACR